MLSFTTNGNFIDFKYTEDQYPFYVHQLTRLHNTSKCITWGYSDDTTRISFTIDDETYDNIPITSIYFDGVVMSAQADFKTNIESMFPGLAGGAASSSYLIYTALLTQAATDAPAITSLQNTTTLGAWSRVVEGAYTASFSDSIDSTKLFFPNGTAWSGTNTTCIPISNEGAINGYIFLYGIDAGGQCSGIGLDVVNSSFVFVDLGTLMTAPFPIEFRVYP